MPKERQSDVVADLRKRAEERLETRDSLTQEKKLQPLQAEGVLHDLRVHQIELEMQNEELQRTQRELETSRNQYFDLFELAPVGYLILNEKGLILEANLTAAKLLDESKRKLSNLHLSRLILPEDQDIFFKHHRALLESGAPQAYELRLKKKGGDTIWVRIDEIAVQHRDGFPGYRGALSDITESKHAEEQLEQRITERTIQLRALAVELTESEAHERRRIGRIIHDELQQLLVAAHMHVKITLGITDPDSRKISLQKIADLIDKSMSVASNLSEDLSFVGFHDEGLSPSLKWIAGWMLKNHQLIVRIHSDATITHIDESLHIVLCQAVRELLFNVTKHAGVNRAELRISVTPDGQIEILVTDKGIGFNVLQKKAAKGVNKGLGLFSIEERLKYLGGKLEMKSAEGHGSSFRLLAPLHQTSKPKDTPKPILRKSTAKAANDRSSPRSAIRILLVDDHKLIRSALASLIDQEPDLEVAGDASNGLQAIERVKKLQPDLVLMDVTMPQMDGITATRRITQDWPHVKVIGLTMHEDTTYHNAMRKAGAIGCIIKTAASNDLILAIRAACRL